MSIRKWLSANTASLAGKTVAITGSTGGIGRELCDYLASLGASLILVDRNAEKSAEHARELSRKYGASVRCVAADMENFDSVRTACEKLKTEPIDALILNAGAYKIPRKICDTGFDNSFQINFVSPYYITRELLPLLRSRKGGVVAVGSIAHDYSKSDPSDVDFRSHPRASRVYGNAKRYLMFSLWELFKNETETALAVAHPGITFTNITSHYPKPIFAVIKYPMKLIFMNPKKACLSILRGVFESCSYMEWIGPRYFNVWGLPKKRTVQTATVDESRRIAASAEEIYKNLRRE